ncbi:MAG: HD domain-containing protein [Campylobacterales bacterium]|nr:HD domain-containing protein [Campylobacterales bacterium]
MTLSEKLEDLIEKKAEDFEISKVFKEDIKDYYASIDEAFNNSVGNSFLYSHTRKIEDYIKKFYRYVIRDSFGDYTPSTNSIPVTFIAMGSFGREELCVHSDVDLMIVYKEVKGFNIKPLMERVLYLAWDAGLKLGHRVHEVEDLKTSADSDPTIRTAMLESRFLFGSKFLWIETSGKLNIIRSTDQETFIQQKLEEQQTRFKKQSKQMEPSLKENIGGTRDSNTLFWISKTVLGIDRLKDLSGSLIYDEDYRELQSAIDFLTRVRNALHLIAGKKEDRVLLQYQRELALKLGFKDTKQRVAERRLMKKIFSSFHDIYIISKFYQQKILRKDEKIHGLIVKENKIYSDFSYRKDSINDFLELYLEQPLDIGFDITFTVGLRHSKIPQVLGLKTKKLLVEIFKREDSHKIVLEFYKAEILEKLMAPFKPILHLPQFDGYHTKSVDIHSIDTLKFLNQQSEKNLIELFNSLTKEEQSFLRFIALFHDIGKGRLKDHSELGARIVEVYATNLKMKKELIDLGKILVKYHTLMNQTAQKEDIHSEKTLLLFVSKIKDKKILDMLYLLTVADVKAVGDGVYNEYTKMLLEDLYIHALPYLQKKEQISEAEKRARKERHLQTIVSDKTLLKKISSIESNLFFIKHKADEIVNLGKKSLECSEYSVYYDNNRHFVLEIFSKKPINLGWLLGEFAWNDILSMDIFKLTSGVKYFKIGFKEEMDEESLSHLNLIIEASFDMARKLRYQVPKIKNGDLSIDCDHSPTYGRMNLETHDQKGLLAHVIYVFDSFGIDIATAKISTIKKRTNDLFLIEKNGKFCNYSKEIIEKLTNN